MNTPSDLELLRKLNFLKARPPIRPHKIGALTEHLFGEHVVIVVLATHCGIALCVIRSTKDWMEIGQITRPKPGFTFEVMELYPATVTEARHLM